MPKRIARFEKMMGEVVQVLKSEFPILLESPGVLEKLKLACEDAYGHENYEKDLKDLMVVATAFLKSFPKPPIRIQIEKESSIRESHYKHDGLALKLPFHDCDLRMILPNGDEMVFQWRIENETVDICLGGDGAPAKKHVYVTQSDLSGAKKSKGALVGEQITIM